MTNLDHAIPPGFESLWKDAEAIWTQHQDEPAFEGYVSADYRSIYQYLLRYQSRCTTFLEWGSGLGVVTIMAANMGYQAYGLEIEPTLVDFAIQLADQYQSTATFALGSFVPEAYQTDTRSGEEYQRTVSDAASGYDELNMDLDDMDLVYAYPWPEEHLMFRRIFQRYGAENGTLLCFDAREGVSVTKKAKRSRR